MSSPVVHRPRLSREAIPVDSAAKVDNDMEDSVVELDREEIPTARLSAVVEDKSVRFYGPEVEFQRSLELGVPQRKPEIGAFLGERDGSRFAGRCGICPSRDGVDVAVDLDVGGSWLDEGNVYEVYVAR